MQSSSSGSGKVAAPPVDMIDTAKKANRSSVPLLSPDDTISPLPGDASTVPSSSPPDGAGSKLIAQNLRDIINKENIPAPPLLASKPSRPPKARVSKPPSVAGRKEVKSKKHKKSKRFTLPFLLGYENMVRAQDNADASTITHLRPVFDKLRYIGGDTDVQPAGIGVSDGNDSTTSLGCGDDRSTGTSGTLDTYGTADRSDADKESDALSYLTSLSNRIDMDDGTLLTFAAIAQSLDVLIRKEYEMTCDNHLILLLQSITDAVRAASTSQSDEIDEEFELDGLTFTEFLHAYQSVAISIRAMRRFPKEGEDRKARTRDRAQQLLVSFIPSEIVVEEENLADVDLNENDDEGKEENEGEIKTNVESVSSMKTKIKALEDIICDLTIEKKQTLEEAQEEFDQTTVALSSKIEALESENRTLLDQITVRDEMNSKRERTKAKKMAIMCSTVALSAAAAGITGASIWSNMTLDVPRTNARIVDTHMDDLERNPVISTDVDKNMACPDSQINPRSTNHFALRKKLRKMEADQTRWRTEAQIAQERIHELINTFNVSNSETARDENSKAVNQLGNIRSHVVSLLSGATVAGLTSNIANKTAD